MSACEACVRRSWLLGALNGRLEYRGRAPDRLVALLELPDEQLIRAVGGSETERLLKAYAQVDPAAAAAVLADGTERICCHDPRYPGVLSKGAGMPRLLHVVGGLDRLGQLLDEPTVAIVGTRAASDYGMEVAHGLARGLAACGVTIVGGLADGIASAALAGALDVAGPTVTVAAGGVDVCHPTRRRTLQLRLRETGCALGELPCGQRPRSWCHTARARIVVALARIVILVEAHERPGELVHARLAQETGRVVGAIPGRLCSPLASGPHALLRDEARLVRDTQDVLEMLYADARSRPAQRRRAPRPEHAAIEPGLRAVLDQVGTGRDTVAKLLAAGAPEQETLVALARLELGGALVRGDAGRYVARL
jgi:DNA processing protein